MRDRTQETVPFGEQAHGFTALILVCPHQPGGCRAGPEGPVDLWEILTRTAPLLVLRRPNPAVLAHPPRAGPASGCPVGAAWRPRCRCSRRRPWAQPPAPCPRRVRVAAAAHCPAEYSRTGARQRDAGHYTRSTRSPQTAALAASLSPSNLTNRLHFRPARSSAPGTCTY